MSLMLQEIFEQPHALERTLSSERRHAERLSRRMHERRASLIVLVARGTSDNAAQFGRYLLEISTGIPVSLAAPSVHTLYRARLRLSSAIVIGISQSGESTDINITLENAKRSGAMTIGITNDSSSPLAKIVDEVFVTRAGRERSVAATKTYTTQLMVLYLLASALRNSSGEGFKALARIPEWTARALKLQPTLLEMVERYRFMRQCAVVGRGLNYANALELGIKLMETCYVGAERFSSADFLHGPIAMVEGGFPVFVFAPPGQVFPDIRNLIYKLGRLKAETVVISSETSILEKATRALRIPDRIPDLYSPIPYIVPGQMFSALLAEAKGLSPDRPRSLSKITRTV
ncbi:MAG: SIS domain-containing protein [Acidobacteriia bacterium]|nr:SIS domain-containing protein [Terriglobia bacterium]